jgi:hypothetical protein
MGFGLRGNEGERLYLKSSEFTPVYQISINLDKLFITPTAIGFCLDKADQTSDTASPLDTRTKGLAVSTPTISAS